MRKLWNRDLGPAVALALFAAVLWGVSGTVAADAFSEVSPPRVAQARSLVAVVLLLPYAWKRGLLRARQAAPLLLAFGISLAVVHVTYYWAVDALGVGPGVTLQFLAPVLVMVWMRIVQKRRVQPLMWLAGVGAVAGITLVTRAWDTEALYLPGVLAGLGAAASFAAYLLIGEALTRRVAPATALTYGLLVAVVIWAVAQPLWSFPRDLSAKVWVELAWVGTGGTMVPFLALIAAMRRASAALVGVVATFEPVVAGVTAWVFLAQSLAPIQIAGGLIVVAAVAVLQRWGVADIEVPLEAAR